MLIIKFCQCPQKGDKILKKEGKILKKRAKSSKEGKILKKPQQLNQSRLACPQKCPLCRGSTALASIVPTH
jgi:hypothetical protein